MSNLLSQASLVMIPSGYKEDVVYSAIPTNGSGDLSFTRASNGTRVNSAGLVEVVAWNLVQQSETFDNVAWIKQFATVTANSTTAPNGTLTADTFNVTATAYSSIYNNGALSLSLGIYTQGIYAKKGTKNYLYILDLTATSAKAWFNLDTGVVGTVASGYTATMESVGNGWYRCSLSQNTSITPSYFHFGASDSDNSFTPSSSGNIYIWGAQLNIGSTAKPYFPTTDRLNVPRLTYQNGGGGCPSLLLEKQSTNVCLYSEQIDNASWDKVNGSGGTAPVVTANYGISPDGTQNADRVQLARTTAAGSYSYVYQTITLSASATYTVSVYLKSLSGTPTISIALDGVGYDHVVTMTTEWARYEVEIVAGGSFDRAQLLLYQAVASTSLTADFLAWGFQVEQSSYPTSYIPTTSSSATRVADACSKTGISSLIGQTEGVIFVDWVYTKLDTSGIIPITIGLNSSNHAYILIDGALRITFDFIESGGASGRIQTASGYAVEGTRYKMAFAYKANDFAAYINGQLIGTDSVGSVTGLSELYFSYPYSAGYSFPNLINQVALFKTRLTNAELASLTTI